MRKWLRLTPTEMSHFADHLASVPVPTLLEGISDPQVQVISRSATQALGDNLQRALDTYAARAEQLQAQIDNATDELHDVRRAQEAATTALGALVGEVAQHALDLELSA